MHVCVRGAQSRTIRTSCECMSACAHACVASGPRVSGSGAMREWQQGYVCVAAGLLSERLHVCVAAGLLSECVHACVAAGLLSECVHACDIRLHFCVGSRWLGSCEGVRTYATPGDMCAQVHAVK